MHVDWNNAHTDYSDHAAGKDHPVPAGLAESESAWHQRLNRAPNGWLLRGNAMVQALASGHPVHLMHTTVALDAIRTSGHLLASSGCLVAALYCAPLTPEPGGGLRPHNLGTYLLDTKKHTRTLVLEVTPDRPVPPKGINYLRLGAVHLRTYLTHRSFLTPTEDEQLRHAALARIQATGPFLDLLLANACGLRTPEAEFADRLSAAVAHFPFLGYLYFEVLSEYLMLHSSTTETKRCAEAGELNNHLYKQLAHSAVEGMDQLFDLSRFNPRHDRLVELVGQVDPALAPGAARYTRARLAHLFAGIALHPSQDAATFSFQQRSFEELATAAPGLLGQLLFRELRVIDRYPQLYLSFEQAKALEAWTYWNDQGIAVPFNGTTPKGEIGINPAYPRAGVSVWIAERCERGLLHPVEELDVTPHPRLADLNMTAMRRDDKGKAAGHLLSRSA